jgi:hypothetical protein
MKMKISDKNKVTIGVLGGVVLLAVFLVGCTINSAPKPADLKEQNIVYFKDSRTGICYAALNSLGGDYSNTTTITYVPCTPEVEKLIK